MEFDVLLPTVIFFVIAVSVFLYRRFEKKITLLFEEKKLSTRDILLMVTSMGLMVTAIVFIPSQAIQIAFIAAYSYMMFIFAYLALERWYLAIFPPVAFILFYFFYWDLLVFNLFVVFFAVIITVYLSELFSWRTVWLFAVLLTVMDVIQVFGTGFMGETATKMLELKLPVLLLLPAFPAGGLMGLGLGDIFLAGLLAVQTALRRGQKAGVLTAAAIGIAMFVFEVALLNTMFAEFFPATVVVIAGWFLGLGIARSIELRPRSSYAKADKPDEKARDTGELVEKN
jgi:hypothetical protein